MGNESTFRLTTDRCPCCCGGEGELFFFKCPTCQESFLACDEVGTVFPMDKILKPGQIDIPPCEGKFESLPWKLTCPRCDPQQRLVPCTKEEITALGVLESMFANDR